MQHLQLEREPGGFHPHEYEKGTLMSVSFEAACLPLQQSLFARAMHLTRNRASAKDLVQDTYVRALTSWSEFRVADGEDPTDRAGAWLYRIMHSVFVSRLRRTDREREILNDYADAVADLTMSRSAAPQTAFGVRVTRALSELPAEFAEAALRVDAGGETPSEVGASLGVDARTVRTRLHRARRRLRDSLAA